MSAGGGTFCSRVSFGRVTYLVLEERAADTGATCLHQVAVRYGRDRVRIICFALTLRITFLFVSYRFSVLFLCFTLKRSQVHRIIQHTWRGGTVDAPAAVAGTDSSSAAVTSILSYNLWNSNPPKWIFHGAGGRTRREWYDKRLDHFTSLILRCV